MPPRPEEEAPIDSQDVAVSEVESLAAATEVTTPALTGVGGEVLAVTTPSMSSSFLLPPMAGPGPGIGTGTGNGVGPGRGFGSAVRSKSPNVPPEELRASKVGEMVRNGWLYLGDDTHSLKPVWVPLEGTEFFLSGWPNYRDRDWDDRNKRLKKIGI